METPTTTTEEAPQAPAELNRMQQVAADLRKVAALIEALDHHERVGVSASVTIGDYSPGARWRIMDSARILAPCTKHFGDFWFSIDKEVGDIRLSVSTSRDAVCRKIETEVEVPEEILPATEERIIPAHTKKVVEWECDPLFAPGEVPAP